MLRRSEAVTTSQLYAMGYSAKQLRHLVAHGDLHRRHRGVYVDGRNSLSPRGHLRAALLACPDTAFLSHRTGAAVRGYRAINTREIHITVPGDHTPRIPGLRLHRTTAGEQEVSKVGSLRVATLPLLLLQFAATHDRGLEDLIAAAARKQTLDPEQLERFFTAHAHAPGIGRLKQALEYYRPTPEGNSKLEAAVHAWLAEHPEIPPADEINAYIGPYEWDCLWHDRRVALEIDGRDWHSAMEQKEKDPLKDVMIQRLGYRIIRCTGWRFRHDRRGFYDDLMSLLALQRAA